MLVISKSIGISHSSSVLSRLTYNVRLLVVFAALEIAVAFVELFAFEQQDNILSFSGGYLALACCACLISGKYLA